MLHMQSYEQAQNARVRLSPSEGSVATENLRYAGCQLHHFDAKTTVLDETVTAGNTW